VCVCVRVCVCVCARACVIVCVRVIVLRRRVAEGALAWTHVIMRACLLACKRL